MAVPVAFSRRASQRYQALDRQYRQISFCRLALQDRPERGPFVGRGRAAGGGRMVQRVHRLHRHADALQRRDALGAAVLVLQHARTAPLAPQQGFARGEQELLRERDGLGPCVRHLFPRKPPPPAGRYRHSGIHAAAFRSSNHVAVFNSGRQAADRGGVFGSLRLTTHEQPHHSSVVRCVVHFVSANTWRSKVKSMTASTFTSLPVVCLISPSWVLIALSLPNPSGLTDLIERV